MSRYVSIRLATATRGEHGGQGAHDMRTGRIPDYVDRSRSKHNSYLIEPPTPSAMAAECLARRQTRTDMKRRARSIRSDGIVAISGLLSFSADAQPIIHALSKDEQDRRYKAAAEAAAEALGATLAGLVVHRDESAPHAHFTLYGYRGDGKPISTKLQQGTLSRLQDQVAMAYVDLGITRGKRIVDRILDGEDRSKTVHRSVRELHQDLPRELAAARARVVEAQAEVNALETSMAAVKLPDPPKFEVVTGRTLGVPRTEMRPLYVAAAVSRAVKHAEASKREAEAKAKKAEQALQDQEQELDRLRKIKVAMDAAMDQWSRVACADGHYLDFDFIEVLGTPIAARYGVQLAEQHDGQTVIAPPQVASVRQIGAALYKEFRVRGWNRINVTATDEVAAAILDLAREDGIEDRFYFARQGSDFKTRRIQDLGMPEVDQVLSRMRGPGMGGPP